MQLCNLCFYCILLFYLLMYFINYSVLLMQRNIYQREFLNNNRVSFVVYKTRACSH